MVPKTLVILATALTATATNVHNQFGHSGWIQDDQGTDVALNNKGSATVGGGWGFFWVSGSVCSKNSVTYTWPSNYGDVYIRSDGFLYDASDREKVGVNEVGKMYD
ncbi:uncharacterized protein N7496_007935 [Penicillium cataractarum]|uniref:Uncharacterized protein n=1 Tax=Penicillium cataractarum TaxID=2100454 RepID=A0A9W9RYT2_9EURO|nr:uncharacterized protein N7496_007935 [Penicillium cataractarum]KAJ5368175.1 hypothetical protein N7496_007935 [Penicillium cataractarum]